MNAWSPDFQINYGSETPLRVAAPSYTNETNVAQAWPLWDIGIMAPGGGLRGTNGGAWVPQPTHDPTPTNPAAPHPQASPAASDAQKKANPVVWIGLAAGILVILWAMR